MPLLHFNTLFKNGFDAHLNASFLDDVSGIHCPVGDQSKGSMLCVFGLV